MLFVVREDMEVEGLPKDVGDTVRAQSSVRHRVEQGWYLLLSERTRVEVSWGRNRGVGIMDLV